MAKISSYFVWELNYLISRTLSIRTAMNVMNKRTFTLEGTSLTELGLESGDVLSGTPVYDPSIIEEND